MDLAVWSRLTKTASLKVRISRFDFVGSPNATKNITDRYFGYCKAMQRAGMEEEQFRFVADRECGKGNYRLEIELPENCHRDLSAIAIKRQCCCLKD